MSPVPAAPSMGQKAIQPTKPLLRTLAGLPSHRPPLWLMRQAGRYLPEYRQTRAQAGSFLELCYNPELAAEVTLQPIRRFGFDAAILFADILLIPQALGQHLAFRENEGPVLDAIRTSGELARLNPGGIHKTLGPVYEAVGRIKAALPPDCTLIGFAGAPWTVATYMLEGKGSKEFAAAKTWAFGNPLGLQTLMEILIEATVAYLDRQVQAGAEVVQLFDTWAGVLPEQEFRKFCIEPVRRIIAALKEKYPALPVIAFPRGAGALYEGYAQATGADALGLDYTMPLGWTRDHLWNKTVVQGNLDPRLLVVGGSAMAEAVHRLLATFQGRNHIFNLGHGIVPETPVGHVEELVRLVKGTATEA
ncbi:MAG: uroporphyrinogen decarboxylase [Ferrovibrio sp.]|uniref:uroporphyrinogen decarboxylase n=1 Tax=Ferrovibrio sp. TaxID=1917215 RepID=UPI00260E3E44|nr:uroporphyrinogen decarboxylase [Ferrovibrio sp.]MCW0233092.1 uroporphyrinogen decarboxylase [Ferrovibrio sp.]